MMFYDVIRKKRKRESEREREREKWIDIIEIFYGWQKQGNFSDANRELAMDGKYDAG